MIASRFFRNIILIILPLIACSNNVDIKSNFNSLKNNSKLSVAETITDIFHREYNNAFEDELSKEDISITSYCGHVDNVYITCMSPMPPAGWFHISNIIIYGDSSDENGKYLSETSYRGYGLPLVFTKDNLFALDDALIYGLIDVELIKTFDDFQNSHSPKELYEVYYD